MWEPLQLRIHDRASRALFFRCPYSYCSTFRIQREQTTDLILTRFWGVARSVRSRLPVYISGGSDSNQGEIRPPTPAWQPVLGFSPGVVFLRSAQNGLGTLVYRCNILSQISSEPVRRCESIPSRRRSAVGWVEPFANPISFRTEHDGYRFCLRSAREGERSTHPTHRPDDLPRPRDFLLLPAARGID
jgi:hypothetical protein